MKKFFLTLVLLLATIANVSAMSLDEEDYGWFKSSSYRGLVEAYGMMDLNDESEFNVSLLTSHGFQVSKSWFAGAGLGYIFNTDESASYLPIFVHTRFELPGVINDKIAPFADVKSGVTIALDGSSDSGVFQSQTIGCRFAIGNGKCGISPGFGYTILPESNCLHLSVSFDF